MPFSSNDISFQVYQDSIYLGSGSIPDGLYLPKYDTSLVSIFFNFDKRQLHMMSTLSDSLNLTIIGRAEISRKHAGIIINLGGATATDVLELIQLIRSRVLEKFRINLELEQELVGFNQSDLIS